MFSYEIHGVNKKETNKEHISWMGESFYTADYEAASIDAKVISLALKWQAVRQKCWRAPGKSHNKILMQPRGRCKVCRWYFILHFH